MNKQIFRGARELAAYTGFSANAIHLLVARGVLPVHRHGRLLIFLKNEIDEFFAKLPGTTTADALEALRGQQGATRQPRTSPQRRNRDEIENAKPDETI